MNKMKTLANDIIGFSACLFMMLLIVGAIIYGHNASPVYFPTQPYGYVSIAPPDNTQKDDWFTMMKDKGWSLVCYDGRSGKYIFYKGGKAP